MADRIIYRRDLVRADPRLGRHVHHDERSRLYPFDTRGLVVQSVTHERHIPILDQGQVGSCTGNAGIGALGSDPTYPFETDERTYPLDEPGAVKLYSDAEDIDGDGPYPPNDNGSCGLSIAKALKNAGLISGYQHTFTLDDALKATSAYPSLWGMLWFEAGFTPDRDGRVHIGGKVAGGHEIVCRQIDAERQRLWFDNSWGDGWGLAGRFYLTFNDAQTLLAQQGDVIVLLPPAVPVPIPTDPDVVLRDKTKPWADRHHSWPGTKAVAQALEDWYVAKGLS